MIIAGAGGAAHLPGMLASKSVVPVFGVPVETNYLNGADSFFRLFKCQRVFLWLLLQSGTLVPLTQL